LNAGSRIIVIGCLTKLKGHRQIENKVNSGGNR
jgi:hypothetical protein